MHGLQLGPNAVWECGPNLVARRVVKPVIDTSPMAGVEHELRSTAAARRTDGDEEDS